MRPSWCDRAILFVLVKSRLRVQRRSGSSLLHESSLFSLDESDADISQSMALSMEDVHDFQNDDPVALAHRLEAIMSVSEALASYTSFGELYGPILALLFRCFHR